MGQISLRGIEKRYGELFVVLSHAMYFDQQGQRVACPEVAHAP